MDEMDDMDEIDNMGEREATIMLFELNMIPLGGDSHLSSEIARVLDRIDKSGLPYVLTPTTTCIEGEWDEVLPLIRRCHEDLRQRSTHVVTTIKIADDAEATNKLTSNVTSVEAKVGRPLKRIPA
jgi:uncharacterized protein (TIGR00106 family)